MVVGGRRSGPPTDVWGTHPPDMFIRGTNVLDASGGFAGPVDVVVSDGVVAAVGNISPGRSQRPSMATGSGCYPESSTATSTRGYRSFDTLELLRTPLSRRVLETAGGTETHVGRGRDVRRDAGIGGHAGVREQRYGWLCAGANDAGLGRCASARLGRLIRTVSWLGQAGNPRWTVAAGLPGEATPCRRWSRRRCGRLSVLFFAKEPTGSSRYCHPWSAGSTSGGGWVRPRALFRGARGRRERGCSSPPPRHGARGSAAMPSVGQSKPEPVPSSTGSSSPRPMLPPWLHGALSRADPRHLRAVGRGQRARRQARGGPRRRGRSKPVSTSREPF